MKKTRVLIGVLGGTFDPIHYGHLRMGQEILERHQLDRVHFVPCFSPVHRRQPLANAAQRFAMLQMAINHEPRFIADDREIKRQSPSFTVDTLLSLKADMPEATLCLLIGSDAFLSYPTWREPHRILELAHIIVAHRPQYQVPTEGDIMTFLDKYQSDDADTIQQQQAGCILFQSMTALDISAKAIRMQIETHQSPRYLLPDNVYNYIQTNNLYLTK